MDFDPRRIGAVCGLIATAGFLSLYLTAILLNPGHRPDSDYLSDLGVPIDDGHVQNPWPFNLGCMLGGAFALPFAFFALRPALRPGLGREAGIGTFALASVALVLVGIFTESSGATHSLVAAVFFLGMVAAALVLLPRTLRVPALGRPAGLLSAVYVVLAFAFIGTGSPLVETGAVLAIVAWSVFASARLLSFSPMTDIPPSRSGT